MDKDKYKDHYITVLQALEKARVQDTVDGYTRLYITTGNGLINIPLLELKDIIESMQHEKIVEINHFPIVSELLEDNKPKYHSKEFVEALIQTRALEIYPRPLWPMNYYSLTLEEKFHKVMKAIGPPIFLLSLIPSDKGHHNHRVITKLLIQEPKVKNCKIATKIRIRENGVRLEKITKDRYFRDIKYFNGKIKNCNKTLKKLFQQSGYKVKFEKNWTKLIKL